jgi:hypothetical protein
VNPDHAGAAVAWTLDGLRNETLVWLGAHDWLGGKCTVREVDKWRFHEFAALLFPAASPEIAACAGFWSQLIAVLDDVCEDDRTAIGTLRRLVVERLPKERELLVTLARAWKDLSGRIAGKDSAYHSYLRAAFDDLLDSYEWEHDWRRLGGFPPPSEYETWRWRSGGVRIFAAILAQQAGIDAPRLERPVFRHAVQAAGTLACMANDGASASWDEAQKNPINAVCVAAAHGHPFEAWRATWSDRLSALAATAELAEAPLFRDGLRHLVQGTARWMTLTARYDLASASPP